MVQRPNSWLCCCKDEIVNRVLSGLAVLALVVFAGCADDGNTVSANVNFDDGTPVPHGEVRFSNESFETFGKIEDGKVDIGGIDGGMPPGTYKVAVLSEIDPSEHAGGKNSAVAEKFRRPDTSGITVEVTGDKDIDIVVERP